MKTISLPSGESIVVDDADYARVASKKWHVNLRYEGKPANISSGRGQDWVTLHWFILGRASDGMVVDHINGDVLDNRRSNLRVCTHAQNMINRKMHKNNKCGFKGVWYDASRNKFRASIKRDNKRYYIGRFDSPEDAHAAYLKAAKKIHGEYARG